MAELDWTYDKKFELKPQGFDVTVQPSDQGDQFLWAEVKENNADVFSADIPIPEVQPGESVQDVVPAVAQAAVDLLEGERNTLGWGAGALEVQGNKKMLIKQACLWEISSDEDWFMKFKGTQYEEIAYNLLKEKYNLSLENSQSELLAKLNKELDQIEYELTLLNLERMKSCPANKKIIIIQGALKRSWLGDTEMIQDFMDKFISTKFEIPVVKLVKKYLDLKDNIDRLHEAETDNYMALNEIRNKMSDLEMEALQANIDDILPVSGIDAYPNMANELAPLMEGVSIDEPLMPFNQPNQFFASKLAFEEVEPVEKRICEKGLVHEGLDPAEVDKDKFKFQVGDKVSLSKKLECSTVGGLSLTIEKGTSGKIWNDYDGCGDCYMVAFSDGMLLKVPTKHLKKA